MSETEETMCPLCMEEMDLIDRNFLPCPCGYRVCMWCWHHIRENLNGLCPACRVPYKEDPHAFAAVDRTEVVKKNKERKQKEKQERKVTDKPTVKSQPVDRRHLHNYRVIQRNLVYIIGVPGSIATEETLRKAEYFGQYGKITKIVIHRNHTSHATVSAYITFAYKEDAKAAIQSLEGFWLEGHHLRASFGTTKYCNNFIRGVPCNNPECVYLHELGEDEDRFTKEEIQAGQSKLVQQPGKDQTIVTGNGGPSGTGKRPSGEPILPPPVFVQDLTIADRARHKSSGQLSSADESPGSTVGDDESFPPMDALPAAQSQPKSFQSNVSVNDMLSTTIANLEDQKVGDRDSDPQEIPDDKSSSQIAYNAPSQASNPTTSFPTSSPSVEPAQQPSANEKVSSTPVKKPAASTSPLPYTLPSVKGSSGATSFNGISNSAVFPVPASSLSMSIWSNILGSSNSDLKVNPYALISIPISELFELTLPPVDACSMTPWPKPNSYYSQGTGPNGQTHGPPSQHILYRSMNQFESTEYGQVQPAPAPQGQVPHQQFAGMNINSNRPPLANQAPAGRVETGPLSKPPLYNNGQQFAQPGQQQGGNPPIAMLQQMFPTVNMAYVAPRGPHVDQAGNQMNYQNVPVKR